MSRTPDPFMNNSFKGLFRSVKPILVGISDCSDFLRGVESIRIPQSFVGDLADRPKRTSETTAVFGILSNIQNFKATFFDDEDGAALEAIMAYQNELNCEQEVEFVLQYMRDSDQDTVVRELRFNLTEISLKLTRLDSLDYTGECSIDVEMSFDKVSHVRFKDK